MVFEKYSRVNRPMHGDGALLTVKNLCVNYKSYWYVYHVLDGVSIDVKLGEKVGLIGESGAGKTTLLKSILRVLPPQGKITSGEILYRGIDLLKCDAHQLLEIRRRKIGMIFQDPLAALNPLFKVKEQMLDILKYTYETSDMKKRELENIALDLLRDTLIPDSERVLNSYPFELSGGMRQRVVIAMALASASELLLADEPTTNIDVTIQAQILKLISDLVKKKGLSMVLVSHALGMVRKMTDKVYVIYGGNIVEEAPTSKLFENPLHPYTRLLIDNAPKILSGMLGWGIKGNPVDYRFPPSGCRFHPRCPFGDQEICKSVKPPLIKEDRDRYVACHLYGG
ncbi:MAG: ABC transporter ATP-binding protein [Nitrososphaerota archaeon]|nr:ABC transporter ATP-binding protein [Aigarchaeota archaeon]MDW8076529.1 ABC transporter ATP-binding protein [Nitrososphaerota archaeon]